MDPMLSTLPTLMVTAVYYCWHVYHLEKRRRIRLLRERVTYMLWVMAVETEEQSGVTVCFAKPALGCPAI